VSDCDMDIYPRYGPLYELGAILKPQRCIAILDVVERKEIVDLFALV
jgi:hypothetical protein